MTIPETYQRELGDYFRRRFDHLARCNAEIESKLRDDEADLCRRIDSGEFDKSDPAVGRMIHHIEYVVGNTFRYTMLVGACSFLEEAVKAITKVLVSDYDARIKALKRKDNWLRIHVRVLSESGAFDPGAIRNDLYKFHDLIALRNCIVHSWGNVAKTRHPAAVERAVERIKPADVSRDGYLLFESDLVPEALCTAEDIVDAISKSGFGESR